MGPRSSYRPTPWDVLELEWCPRYLWLSKRHGVPTTPSMARGRAEEEALRRRLAAALGGEPRPVHIDAGWAHGVVDMLARGRSAVPALAAESKFQPFLRFYSLEYLLFHSTL